MSEITHNLLKLIIADQKNELIKPYDYIPRAYEAQLKEFSLNKEIIVLTGLRRSGKSVLLNFSRQQSQESDYYFNFEDERLVLFTVSDFQTLVEVFIELFGTQKTFFFDEIQNIPGWEMFVRRLYNNGNKIYITGSNANLFSEELGTRLTGRYIPINIYPISFKEYLNYKDSFLLKKELLSTTDIGLIKKAFSEYCTLGGIPEYIKHKQLEYLNTLYESILYRDIIARYKISQDLIMKKLVFYLASNCSKEVTFNSLKNILGIGSASTVSDYCYYLEKSYLCFFVNRYSDSVKVQIQSPKKVYFIDPIIAKSVGFKISADYGRMLENIVFLELKRKNYEVYYHKEIKECDFIIRKEGKTQQAIQVTKEFLEPKTKQREIEGLLEALQRFSLQEGLIITEHEESIDFYEHEGQKFKITILPLWKWLINE